MQTGIITKWQDDRGFGFIDIGSGSNENLVFFHVSEYRPKQTPKVGEPVVFQFGKDNKGRKQAKKVQSAEFAQKRKEEYQIRQNKRNKQQEKQHAFESVQRVKLSIVGFCYLLLAILVILQVLPWVFLAWYVVIGILTFAMYAKDKDAAQNGEWRTKEATLHTLAISGGWLGALVAHAYLRHKSQKAEFRRDYYVSIVINIALLVAYIYFNYTMNM